MNCDKCAAAISPGDERDHYGMTLCEDCFIDSLSTVKPCDPWAARSAQNCEKLVSDGPRFTAKQSEILQILKKSGPMQPEKLVSQLAGNNDLEEVQRDFAILHHMGKVGAKKQEQGVLWLLT